MRNPTTPKSPNPSGRPLESSFERIHVLPHVAEAVVYNHDNPNAIPRPRNRHERRAFNARVRKAVHAAHAGKRGART